MLFDEKELNEIYESIKMRINYLETGNPIFSRNNAVEMKRTDLMIPIGLEQVKLLNKLYNLKFKIENYINKIKIEKII